MVHHCCVPQCTNRAVKGHRFKFHSFPKDETLRRKWVDAIRRDTINEINAQPLVVNQHTKVCSQHFFQRDYFDAGNIIKLKKNAVPSVFAWTVKKEHQCDDDEAVDDQLRFDLHTVKTELPDSEQVEISSKTDSPPICVKVPHVILKDIGGFDDHTKAKILLALAYMVQCGVISQDHEIEHHERATSYQNVHIEHFHPVPTYVKKEDSHLLEHPVSLGTSSSKVEVHHGDKHDHGYAFASADNNLHGHGFEDFGALAASEGGHEGATYQVHDQGEDYSQFQGHLGEAEAGLGHYQTSGGYLGDGGQEEGYGHES